MRDDIELLPHSGPQQEEGESFTEKQVSDDDVAPAAILRGY